MTGATHTQGARTKDEMIQRGWTDYLPSAGASGGAIEIGSSSTGARLMRDDNHNQCTVGLRADSVFEFLFPFFFLLPKS